MERNWKDKISTVSLKQAVALVGISYMLGVATTIITIVIVAGK